MAHRIRSVQKHHLSFYVFKDKQGQYRWGLYAGNNYEIADGGEGYINKADCVYALNLVATKTGGVPINFAPGITPINPPT